LIAPKSYGGFNLGAYGLVCQMLIVQLLSTNVMLYSNSKYLKTKYSNFLLIQILTIGSLVFLSYGLQLFVDIFNLGLLLRAILFTILLFSILLLVFTIFPKIIGFNILEHFEKSNINKKEKRVT
jgi:membrane-associated HD superfamily phosphohydrolase